MLIPQLPSVDSTLKGARESGHGQRLIPGFPTEGPIAAGIPVVVRRLSSDDKARVKAFSIENDSKGWLKTTLFKKEVHWPRELYVKVQGCKTLVPTPPALTTTTTPNANDPTETDGVLSKRRQTHRSHANGAQSHGSPVSKSRNDVLANASGTQEEAVGEGVIDGGRVGSAADNSGGRAILEDFECFARIMNTTTGNELQTESVKGGLSPNFGESFVVPCQGPRDAVMVGVYSGNEERGKLIGEAVLPLDTRFVGGNREVVLKLRDPDKRNRGFVRVEAFWVDEAKPRKETGDFYYKVVHPSGVCMRREPSLASSKTLHVMEHGEVFKACERQTHAADREDPEGCTVFVRISASADRWARAGWLFESLADSVNGQRETVLERVSPPAREPGHFFYRVCNPKGVCLYTKADAKSKLHGEIIGRGAVIEASEKYTPAGSPFTFVTVSGSRGYIVVKCGEKVVHNEAGEVAMEETNCPKAILISSQGSGEGVPPPPSPPPRPILDAARVSSMAQAREAINGKNSSTAGESVSANEQGSPARSKPGRAYAVSPVAVEVVNEKVRAAVTVQQRLYRVKAGVGVVAAFKAPDITSISMDVMKEGQPFYGKAEVVKKYDGIGEVAFVMRTIDGLWVRANRPGIGLLLDLITDRMEAGAFTYRVSHENGVLVRAAPGLNAPPVKPRRILPVSKLINVCERLVQAEDVIELSRPPVFLRLAGNDGWVFDRRGHTLVCEDVTEKSRIATANAIAVEAARLARLG